VIQSDAINHVFLPASGQGRRKCDKRWLRASGEGVEVFEGEVAAVVDGVERGKDGGPVRGAVEEEAEGVEVELVDFFAVFLEVEFLIRLPRSGIQCSGKWYCMMLPVSKWTFTFSLEKPSTKEFISCGLCRKPLAKMFPCSWNAASLGERDQGLNGGGSPL